MHKLLKINERDVGMILFGIGIMATIIVYNLLKIL